jgi:hypothetical protein
MPPGPSLSDAASLGFRVARTMYSRWRRMGVDERERLEGLANDVKERALELRGNSDRETAGRGLNQASERLAEAMVESAESNPEVSDAEVASLRGDLVRELERLASADVRAARMGEQDRQTGQRSLRNSADSERRL